MYMKHKVLRVVISTNRLEYLSQTTKACERIDYSNLDVHHLIIDDFPKDRNDEEFTEFALSNGFDEVILNKENLGITLQWDKIMSIAITGNYDYVFMHEDDVLIRQDLLLNDLVNILRENTRLSQIQLKRNNWYSTEITPVSKKPSDVVLGNFLGELGNGYFAGLMSIWPGHVSKKIMLMKEDTDFPLGENTIGWYLENTHGLFPATLKTFDGKPMIEHIGEYTRGLKYDKDLPGVSANSLSITQPEVKLNSRDSSKLWED